MNDKQERKTPITGMHRGMPSIDETTRSYTVFRARRQLLGALPKRCLADDPLTLHGLRGPLSLLSLSLVPPPRAHERRGAA